MFTFYLLVLILMGMIWYAGFEGTLRVFAYLDMQMRFMVIKFKMWQMKRKLEKQLDLPPSNFSTLIKDLTNGK
ncbi:hypothetical protein BOW92_gp141 [Synechococcus phage S-WAM1]|uniref:Uncharacterized protein n=1 Tax=Synechococcus phage S-WAM1 TaxID=1815521 RepID=A0A1D8KSE0_9CAUD|nr:hypothetical protein BOW92_gp141 [Synechococcus phage S-WAM1]AOV61576.1 hypothetical protein P090810_103 [Synechococcus phage S-WAM1]